MWVLQNVIMNQKLSKIDNYLPNKKEVNTAFSIGPSMKIKFIQNLSTLEVVCSLWLQLIFHSLG